MAATAATKRRCRAKRRRSDQPHPSPRPRVKLLAQAGPPDQGEACTPRRERQPPHTTDPRLIGVRDVAWRLRPTQNPRAFL
eukprot:scaffold256_cov121-Isochrysis_galbana.AAC.5